MSNGIPFHGRNVGECRNFRRSEFRVGLNWQIFTTYGIYEKCDLHFFLHPYDIWQDLGLPQSQDSKKLGPV